MIDASIIYKTILANSLMNIKRVSKAGDAFPDFLIEHIQAQWSDVDLVYIDPDICLKVDSGLAFCGVELPSARVRQFLYIYHDSIDFDVDTLGRLCRLLNADRIDAELWQKLLMLEFERDCGMTRLEYLSELDALLATFVKAKDSSGCLHADTISANDLVDEYSAQVTLKTA